MTARRPGPLRWLAYAYGARLPVEYREWVLHDVTVRSWWLRHIARATTQLVPMLVLIFFLVPGPMWVRGAAVIGGAAIGYFYSLVYMQESAEHRVLKAGYPRGTAARLRQSTDSEGQAERERRYAERWRHDA
jgi:Family of unknown function (DUF5313)